MKHIFEPSDIKFGMHVEFKSGEISVLGYDQKPKEKDGNRNYYLSQINTDGLVRMIGRTKEDVAKYLTDYNYLMVYRQLLSFA